MEFTLLSKEYSPEYRPGEGGEWNGGNYPQPTYYMVDNLGNHWVLEDSSCGDFGTRRLILREGKAVAYWGSMLEPEQEYSRLSGYTSARLEDLLGIRIPCGGVRV